VRPRTRSIARVRSGSDPKRARERVLLRDDGDRDRGVDGPVEPDRNLDLAELLDGLVELPPAPVDLDTELRLHRLGQVDRGDRAEQLAALAGTRLHLDPPTTQPRGNGLGRLALAAVARLAVAAHRGRLSDGTLAGTHREPARHEEVARVSVGDVEHVALVAEVLDVFTEDDLHDSPSSGAGVVAAAPTLLSSAASTVTPSGTSAAPFPSALSGMMTGARSSSRSRSRSRSRPRPPLL